MSSVFSVSDLDWGLLQAMTRWSAAAAVVIATVALFVAPDQSFTATFAAAAAFDIATMAAAVHVAKQRFEGGSMTGAAIVAAVLGVRLALKALLLAAAAFVPWLNLAGMAVGVLLVDTTVLIAGSVVSAAHLMRGEHGHADRKG